MVGVEDRRARRRTSSDSSERLPHGSSNTVSSHVRIQPCSGLCSLVRSSRSISRSIVSRTSSGSTSSASLVRYSATTSSASPLSPSSLRIACELLAQQELALRLLHALGHAVADLLRHLELGQRLARPRPAPSRGAPRGRASSSSSTLRSTDRSGAQPAVSASAPGSSTPASASAMRGVAQLLGDAAHDGAVLAHHLRARPVTAAGSATGSASTHRPGWSLGDGAADDGARQAAEHQGPLPAGQLALVLDAGDGADAGVPGADPGHEEEAAVAGDGAVGRVTAPRRSRARGSRPSAAARPRCSGAAAAGSVRPLRGGLRACFGHRGSPVDLGDYTIT